MFSHWTIDVVTHIRSVPIKLLLIAPTGRASFRLFWVYRNTNNRITQTDSGEHGNTMLNLATF